VTNYTQTNIQTDHRLHGSVSTVVTMTSKVNGKTEISSPCRSETPENIEAKTGVNDYVKDPLCTFTSLPFFSCRRLQQKRVDGFSRCIPYTTRIRPRM